MTHPFPASSPTKTCNAHIHFLRSVPGRRLTQRDCPTSCVSGRDGRFRASSWAYRTDAVGRVRESRGITRRCASGNAGSSLWQRGEKLSACFFASGCWFGRPWRSLCSGSLKAPSVRTPLKTTTCPAEATTSLCERCSCGVSSAAARKRRSWQTRLRVARLRLWAVGVVVNVHDVGEGVLRIESPSGVVVQMRRVPGSARPLCAVPDGQPGAVVAFT